MARFMTEDVAREVRTRLEALPRPVRILHVTQAHACGECKDQRELLEELAALSSKLQLEVRELVTDAEEARRYRIDKVPATAVLGEQGKDYGIRFFGLTGGYELVSLLETIHMVSSGASGLDPAIEAIARRIDRPLHLEIMVTLTCPYCPRMVRLAHQLAFASEHVRADMIDASEFPALVQRYRVHGVPRTVIDERPAFEGALPPLEAVLAILEVATPELYERVDAEVRTARGERKAAEATPTGTYDILVVGAGPAAMSAALYAVRKNRRVALLGRKVGGQITDTETIENWLGIGQVGGRELADAFRHHVETYPVAVHLRAQVQRIRRGDDTFEVVTDDSATYRARSVVLATGKRYRKLGVPGEDRFLGRGVAFCATCDAPLFRDRRVAVVGGGNSAFTAVRDLLGYAREIHVINILPDWQADPVLFEQTARDARVHLHPAMAVRELFGGDQLEGIRLEAVDGSDRFDVLVDGVFLEIGLEPNTACVRELVALNPEGEVVVRRDQSTNVPGLFAAGDVTDEPEKQIIIAAGDGARAALAADRYLTRHELERRS